MAFEVATRQIYLTDRKLKISTVFIFGIKGAKKAKIFHFLKGRFFVMGGTMNVIFGVFSDTFARLLKSITSHFFQDIAKVIIIYISKVA